MSALETTRNRDSVPLHGSTRRIDSTPILGTWVNFDTEATGIIRLVATSNHGQLGLRVTEALESRQTEWDTRQATALTEGVDQQLVVGFIAEAELPSRAITLCAYLNRGLLTIDAHTRVKDTTQASFMARAHFFLSATGERR